MAKPNKRPANLGTRQSQWLCKARDADNQQLRFSPTTHHHPPAVLRGLIKKGLMWAEKRQKLTWMPQKQEWSYPQPGPEHWCGLTDKGKALLEDIQAWHRQERERNSKRVAA